MDPGHPYFHLPSLSGHRIQFLVGPTTTRFDVHSSLLSEWSSAFAHSNGRPRSTTAPILLPSVSTSDFTALCTWLYEGQKPIFTTDGDLLTLCRLWIAASRLGLWRWMNTLMRQGMALMQPPDFKVDIQTVKYVYDNTASASKLRKFIIAIFCQRTKPLAHFFELEYERLGILRDAAAFLSILEKARHKPPKGKDSQAFERAWMGRYRWRSDEQGNPIFLYDREAVSLVDWGEVEYGLPEHLVWDEHGGVLPDGFFVTPEEGLQGAGEVVKQMERGFLGRVLDASRVSSWRWTGMG